MHYYSDEKNVQILIALFKQHGVKKIVISPGATNDCFVLSVQDDPDFNLYSAVDERHAGYLACGIAQETGQPVVISCTGATASRNYMPALTEAFYSKIPIIALTSSQHSSHIGNLFPQMTDRIHLPSDIVKLSVQCPIPHTTEEEWACQININRAILETQRHGGGPVHINLETNFCSSYTSTKLPKVDKISRFVATDERWPELPANTKIAVWIGAHRPFSPAEQSALENFAISCNAVILTDLTSNYYGKNAIRPAILLTQKRMRDNPRYLNLKPDLVIHIGEVSGDYPTMGYLIANAPTWRVNEDGEIRDRLFTLENVFEMPERVFFGHYGKKNDSTSDYFRCWEKNVEDVSVMTPDIPFSNLWIAQSMADCLPNASVLHLGILNPLRCWNMTKAHPKRAYSTVGGFGIDGGTSSLLGSSIAAPNELHFGVFGDLSFFYDLNALGNRHVQNNVRILLINNGEGAEFSVPNNISDNPYCGERVHSYIAAAGHNGKKSSMVVKHLAEDLGFTYLTAHDKDSFEKVLPQFLVKQSEKPIVFECFTNVSDDCEALKAYNNINPYETCDSASNDSIFAMLRHMVPKRLKNVVKAALGR